MSIAIMQPYVFPYLGYIQLVSAVDKFVFYDDVNFIKKGWINKNRILLNGTPEDIVIPCQKISQNKLICETKLALDNKSKTKLFKKFDHAYGKSSYYKTSSEYFRGIINLECENVSEMAAVSVIRFFELLDIPKNFYFSSKEYMENQYFDRADRLIDITKKFNEATYVNAIGGQELYDKNYFNKKGISLFFLKPIFEKYNQTSNDFVQGLSILDLLSNVSIADLRDMINNYELV